MATQLPTELGEGLVLRRATPGDVSAIVELHAESYGDDPHGAGVEADEFQVRDLLERPHPTFNGDEMTVVEETSTRRIVSSQHLSHHSWLLEGCPFPVGEIEHVSTRVAFRQRGLIRAQTQIMHEWSQTAGEVATAVNGIPWYYTKFGYELPISKYGGRSLVRAFIPGELPQALSPFSVRPAAASDAGFIAATYNSSMGRYGVAYLRTEDHWLYELERRDPRNRWVRSLFILESADQPVGFVSMNLRDGSVDAFELAPGVPWSLAVNSVAQWLRHEPPPGAESRETWSFGWLGSAHPAFDAAPHLFGHPETLGTAFRRGAWYLRIPDIASFVRRVLPALEHRLAMSSEAGYTGVLRIGRYDLPGLELRFDHGRIAADAWQQQDLHEGEARFADTTLLYALFGGRDLAELEDQFPYRVSVAPHARPVLRALFPARPSYLLPVY